MVFAGPGEQATVTDYKGVVAAVVFDVAKLVRRASALSAQIAKRAGKIHYERPRTKPCAQLGLRAKLDEICAG